MYIYESALVQRKQPSGRIVREDVRHMYVTQILNSFQEVWLILTHQHAPGVFYSKLTESRDEIVTVLDQVTIDEWLTMRGTKALPHVSELPTVTCSTVRYRDLAIAGYHTAPVHPSGIDLGSYDDPDYVDLLVYRDDEPDYDRLVNHALFTVNGLVHRASLTSKGIVLKDAAQSIRRSKRNQMGILSFLDIGKLSFHHFKGDQIYNPHVDGTLHSETWLDLKETIGDRIPILVVGGYLIPPGDAITVVGDSTIRVHPELLDFTDKWFDSQQLIDMSTITAKMPSVNFNDTAANRVALLSDDVLRGWFELSQTFVVLVEVDNLFVDYRKLEYTGLPGRYYDWQYSEDPILVEHGRMPEYMRISQEWQWVLAIEPGLRPNPLRYTTDDSTVVDGMNASYKPCYLAPCLRVTIGTQHKK